MFFRLGCFVLRGGALDGGLDEVCVGVEVELGDGQEGFVGPSEEPVDSSAVDERRIPLEVSF